MTEVPRHDRACRHSGMSDDDLPMGSYWSEDCICRATGRHQAEGEDRKSFPLSLADARTLLAYADVAKMQPSEVARIEAVRARLRRDHPAPADFGIPPCGQGPLIDGDAEVHA